MFEFTIISVITNSRVSFSLFNAKFTHNIWIRTHLQVSPVQPAHLTAYHYQAQPQLMRFAAPAAPVVPAAPKPILKEYNIHEGRHAPQPQWAILRSNLDNNFDGQFQYE